MIDFNRRLAEFERLTEIVGADLEMLEEASRPADWRQAEIRGRLEFGFADAQATLAALSGRVEATVDAVCQRCLRPMQLPLAVDLQLVFAPDSGTGHDHQPYEVWELDEELLQPLDVVEESLIMALPFAATHTEQADCSEAQAAVRPVRNTTRPFADLRSQLDNRTDDDDGS